LTEIPFSGNNWFELAADSSGLISPDETDLFQAVARAVTDGLAAIRPLLLQVGDVSSHKASPRVRLGVQQVLLGMTLWKVPNLWRNWQTHQTRDPKISPYALPAL
jgi:hypothetical protein